MTLSEFKAWFEGYTEGLDGAPTEKQFKRIKAKVAEITGTPMTQTVFVEKYRNYWHHPYGWPYFVAGLQATAGASIPNNGVGIMSMAKAVQGAGEAARYSAGDNQTVEWDSHAAMYAAGKAEAAAA